MDGIEVISSTKFQNDFSFGVDRTKLSPRLSREYFLYKRERCENKTNAIAKVIITSKNAKSA